MTRFSVSGPGPGEPSGSYSAGIRVGDLLFLAGQAPELADGTIVRGTITEQVRLSLENLDAVARAAGVMLRTSTVRCGVYLRDLADFDEMDQEYRRHFDEPLPVRTTIQSNFLRFDVEIDAVLDVSPVNGRRADDPSARGPHPEASA